jgi:hypothetical protein
LRSSVTSPPSVTSDEPSISLSRALVCGGELLEDVLVVVERMAREIEPQGLLLEGEQLALVQAPTSGSESRSGWSVPGPAIAPKSEP